MTGSRHGSRQPRFGLPYPLLGSQRISEILRQMDELTSSVALSEVPAPAVKEPALGFDLSDVE